MPNFPYMPMAPRERPNIDIAGSIGGLGDALQQGVEFGQKQRARRATMQALAEGIPVGPDGSPDYMAAAAKIFQGGDPETGLAFTRLAEAQSNTLWTRSQPIYRQGADGALYDLNPRSPTYSGGGQQQATTAQPRRRQPVPADPGDLGGYEPQPDQAADAGQPPPPDQPEQTAAGLTPVLPGKPKKRERQQQIGPDGQLHTYELDPDTGKWNMVSPAKKATPKPLDQDQRKNQQLLTTALPQLAILDKTFDALSDRDNQWAARLTPESWQNFTTSEDYQRARRALARIFIAYTYSVSGATIGDAEALRQADVMLPALGEGPQVIADKKAYIHSMVDSMKQRANAPGSTENAAPAEDSTVPDESASGSTGDGPPEGWTQDEWDMLTDEEKASIQ